MPNTVQVIQFKSQKDINKERKEKMDLRKAELRRQVEAIKSSDKQLRVKA